MSSEPETEAGRQTTNEVLREEIELRAYFKYCERGCDAGYDVDDWLAAEREILAEGAPAVPRDHSSGLRAQAPRPNRWARTRA